jgi:predicted DNA-binding transcriptional regulator YafY
MGRSAFRTLRVDRIDGEVTTGKPFMRRQLPEGDVAAYVARSITTDTYAVRARILLRAPLDDMRAKIPPSIGKLEPRGEQACVLETGANSLFMLAIHIAFLGVDFEVREPPELLDVLKEVSERIGRASRVGKRGARRAGR